MRSHIRARRVCDALVAATGTRSKGSRRTRGRLRLVITSEPELLVNARMVPVGVQVTVKLYENGVEVPVDPVRRFVNPPLMAVVNAPTSDPDGATEFTEDPVAALWDVLWDSVTDFPNPDGWRP